MSTLVFPTNATYSESVIEHTTTTEERGPSSTETKAGVVLSLLGAGVVICVLMIFLSRSHEKRKRQERSISYDRKGKDLLQSGRLKSRNWSRSETMRTVRSMSQTIRDSSSTSCGSSSVASDEGNSGDNPTNPGQEQPQQQQEQLVVPLGTPSKERPRVSASLEDPGLRQSTATTSDDNVAKKFQHLYECQICAVDFQDNDEIYASNNPDCNHQYHRSCIEKWLNYQYTCPICHEVFVLQQQAGRAEGGGGGGRNDIEHV